MIGAILPIFCKIVTQMTIMRPRRSVLYMPGSKPRALEKAKTLAADALIFDLEDAVAPDAKAEARATVIDAVSQGGYGGREVIVRINGLDTPWGAQDLAAVAPVKPDAILIPKVSAASDIIAVTDRLDKDVPLWAMMETPAGILNAATIAMSHPSLAAFVMGTNDLSKELHTRPYPNREPWLTSLQLVLLAARSAGLAAIDGVFGDLNDQAGLSAECVQGAAFGFDGKTLIHPKQLDAANQAFGPDPDALAQAQAVIAGWKEQDGDAKGVVVVNGRMIEALHVAQAQRLVDLADAIEAGAA